MQSRLMMVHSGFLTRVPLGLAYSLSKALEYSVLTRGAAELDTEEEEEEEEVSSYAAPSRFASAAA